MNLLLDTCAIIWLASDPSQLSRVATTRLNDPASKLHVSHASLWEIVLKHGAGKLHLPEPPRKWWTTQIQRWGIIEVPLVQEAYFLSSELPSHHKDPFDRVIVAQAQIDGFHVVSSDRVFSSYGVQVIW